MGRGLSGRARRTRRTCGGSLSFGGRFGGGGPALACTPGASQHLVPPRALARRDMVHTAERPRSAPQDAPGRECCALDGTVPVDGRVAVVGTRWVVLAHGAQQRTDRPLVELDQGQQRVLHRVPPPRSRCRAASRSRASSAWSASPAPGSARTTTRLPGGSWSTRPRIRWRSLRFTLLRTTAPPTALLTTKPARVGGALSPGACGSVAPLRRCTTRCWRPARRPRRTAIAKS